MYNIQGHEDISQDNEDNQIMFFYMTPRDKKYIKYSYFQLNLCLLIFDN